MRLQVLVGFVGTGWIVVVLVSLYYAVSFDPKHNPFQEQGQHGGDASWRANPIDTVALEIVRKPLDRLGFVQWVKARRGGHDIFIEVREQAKTVTMSMYKRGLDEDNETDLDNALLPVHPGHV